MKLIQSNTKCTRTLVCHKHDVPEYPFATVDATYKIADWKVGVHPLMSTAARLLDTTRMNVQPEGGKTQKGTFVRTLDSHTLAKLLAVTQLFAHHLQPDFTHQHIHS